MSALSDQLSTCLSQQAQQLILATTLRQAQALQQSVQAQLNQIRRDRAQPMVEQMQWIAAAAAFANPLPTLDLLATGAINAQLVVDLGAIYGQTFTLEQGKAAAGTLAGVMVKLGLVELSTQALSALLKSSTVTYVAGGFLQGVSAAYLTRLAGLSLIEFFEAQSLQPAAGTLAWDKIGETLRAVFQRTGQPVMLRGLLQQAIARFQNLPASSLPSTGAKTDSLAPSVELAAS
ncbi:MAG: YcjF family protein [Leptolyngbyaceae cyanobacterium SM1_1_3]|nr:YcjF family protein [Leptolyngbyaceae cyanobacterium SM1_1_3]NJM85167.1 YcjF family protein [Leptolyngbyaceae cyanobacterium RM2_2_21]